jgi:hypothetical protein
MLKCREVAELANDLIDKELPWHKSMAVRLHLSMCKYCAGFVRKLELVIAVVREQSPERLSDQNAETIVSKVVAAAGDGPQSPHNPAQNR